MTFTLLEKLRENPQYVKYILKLRGFDESIVDKFVELDNKWRSIKKEIDELRHKHNILTREISKLQPDKRREKIEEAKKLIQEIQNLEKQLKEVEFEREKTLWSIPNLIDKSVIEICPEELDAKPIKFYGIPKVWIGYIEQFKQEMEKYGVSIEYEIIHWKPIGHADMLEYVLGFGDTEKAGEVAGSRFFYLFDDIVWLDIALILYAIDYLTSKGYRLVIPPYMLKHKYLSAVLDLEAFKDAIYKIEDEDLYLIGTSEHPLACYLANRELLESELPIIFIGVSPCFRKEASAGSRDLKGIFRVHQFHKVEQFVFCLPEESSKWHEELIKNAEELWKGLEIPYRVVLTCPRDMSRVAAKQYDLEAWMPAQGRYREMVSCSNCWDWQSYKLNIRVIRKGMRKEYVHTLNSTAIASTRAITAILENHQEPDGTVVIPKVLRKYLEMFQKAPKDVIHPRKKVVRDSSGNPIKFE